MRAWVWLSSWALASLCACGAATSKSSFEDGGAAAAGASAGGASAGGTSAGGASAGGASAGGASAGGASAGGASAGGGGDAQGGAGGEDPAGAGGASAGGASAGGTSAGGTSAGGTSAGGTSAGGASAGGKGGACAAVSSKTTPKTLPVDVIFVIDNSGSMNDEISFIQAKLNAFSSSVVASGVDMHVVMVSALKGCLTGGPIQNCPPIFLTGVCLPAPLGSGSCPVDAKPPNYTHPNAFVNSNDGLNVIMKSWPQWKGALRQDAKKTMVILTDDNVTVAPYDAASFPSGEAGAAAKFIADFTALDPALLKGWKAAGIYPFTKCSSAAAEGKVWREVVKQTGGPHGDLCTQDLQPILDEVQKAVVVGTQIECQWKMPAPPPGLALDPAQVNVVYTDGNNVDHDVLYAKGAAACSATDGGWYFDDEVNPTTVLACPVTCATIQKDVKASVSVAFGCERKGLKN